MSVLICVKSKHGCSSGMMSWTFIVHSIIAFVELATICQAFLKSLSYDPLLSNLSKPLPLADKSHLLAKEGIIMLQFIEFTTLWWTKPTLIDKCQNLLRVYAPLAGLGRSILI